MVENLEFAVTWLKGQISVCLPFHGLLERPGQFMMDIGNVEVRDPDTGLVVANVALHILPLPETPVTDDDLLTEQGRADLIVAVAKHALYLRELSPRHRAAIDVLRNLPDDAYSSRKMTRPNHSTITANKAVKALHKLGYMWSGQQWIRAVGSSGDKN